MGIYWFVVGQGRILLVMFCMGICFGVLYDVLRVIRRLLLAGQIACNLTDVLYWIVVLATTWYVQNWAADGVMRFCQLLTVAMGMLLYYIILSPTVMWVLYAPLHFVGKHLRRIYRYIVRRANAFWGRLYSYIQSKRKKDGL